MYYIQNIVSSIKFKSIRSAGTAEAIGNKDPFQISDTIGVTVCDHTIEYKGFTSLGILNTWASGTLMGFHFF